MKVKSKLPCNAYLLEMRESLSSFTDFGRERLIGFVVGNFFVITHHADFEWNRRITGEMHSAIGFVKAEDTGTKVICMRTAGALNPISLIALYCFSLLCTLFNGLLFESTGLSMLIALVVSLIAAGITAITNSVTEQGAEGRKTLTAFLIDPANYYS